ncbi:hypothetical protein ASD89_17205 [Caulobacter sp. Root656]|nr:hypothetical protein ASD89_17205 [Caulobacter sp. Root656]
MTRARWGAAWIAAVLLWGGPALSQAPDDPHVALRTRAGLPAASAAGEVRIYRLALYLPAQDSTVARRDPRGRWMVSRVRISSRAHNGVRATRWRLNPKSAKALERLLEDPALYQASGEIGDEPCLDPGMLVADVTWRGRSTQLSANCESDRFLEALSSLVGAR